ncbi:MAG: GerW family sporulation protein [Oscillospiraceae bacterium]|nr:GerW family sporulation protein [Oscillospiraceae bacterium]
MNEHPIESLMGVTMQKIKEMVDVNTIIGDPITTPDGTVIVPVSKVSYGFASGGSDFPSKKDGKDCFGGGSGAGITINPVGFLTVSKGEIRMVGVGEKDGSLDKAIGMVPDLFDKVSDLFKKKKNNKKDGSSTTPEVIVTDTEVEE